MTTGGEGGMLTTNDTVIWRRAWALKDHGRNYNTVYCRKPRPGFQWLHDFFGTNGRLTEMQSAIGRVQLRKISSWIKIRKRNARILTKFFKKIPLLRVTYPAACIGHAYYKYYVFLRPERLKSGWSRDRIVKMIRRAGVPCFVGSCSEIYLEKAFSKKKLGPPKRLPVAKELGQTSLMFLVHPTLTLQQMNRTCLIIKKILLRAARTLESK